MKLEKIIAILFGMIAISLQPAHGFNLESLLSPGKLSHEHQKLDTKCSECHGKNRKIQVPQCLACHDKVAADIKHEKGFHGLKPGIKDSECKLCHSDHKGRNFKLVQMNISSFEHTFTDFKLHGKHLKVHCSSCHVKQKKWREAAHDCIQCHKTDDVHKGNLGNKCESCHKDTSWRQLGFDHQKTKFPLLGAHKKVVCDACHLDKTFKNTAKKCIACHELNDKHLGQFGKKCEQCHQEVSWKKTRFDHKKQTDFALTGAHKSISCGQCHVKSDTKNKLPETCVGCHKTDDVHFGARGPLCKQCHNNRDWSKTHFDHNKTRFPLKGKHQKLVCQNCHIKDIHQPIASTTCDSCHKKDDPHKGNLGAQCDQCHQVKGWKQDITFDHDLTSFPLLGLHATVGCGNCHDTSVFKKTEPNCQTCHKEDDPHKNALGEKCNQCHSPSGWSLWNFNHNKETDFLLEGKHEGLSCKACHNKPLKQQFLDGKQCGSCHQKDDPHRGEFGLFCSQCHNTRDFSQLEMQ